MKRRCEWGFGENSHGGGGKSGTARRLENGRSIPCTYFEGCDICTASSESEIMHSDLIWLAGLKARKQIPPLDLLSRYIYFKTSCRELNVVVVEWSKVRLQSQQVSFPSLKDDHTAWSEWTQNYWNAYLRGCRSAIRSCAKGEMCGVFRQDLISRIWTGTILVVLNLCSCDGILRTSFCWFWSNIFQKGY